MFTINKLLPNGKTATRTVTEEEYINDGWAKSGWAAPPTVQMRAEAAQEAQLTDELKKRPTEELRAMARKWKIVKKLPNGKWATRTVYGGEYENDGWRSQGWIIPSYMHIENQKPPSQSPLAKNYYIRRIKAYQDWWRPKRSFSQAQAYYAPMTKIIDSELGHNAQDDIQKIQSGLYNPNPKWRDWLNRGQIWMAQRYKKLYRMSLGHPHPKVKHNTRVDLYKRYNDRVRAPPKVTPVNREKVTKHWRFRHFDRLN